MRRELLVICALVGVTSIWPALSSNAQAPATPVFPRPRAPGSALHSNFLPLGPPGT
jgi:hypothetical protein